MGKRPTSAELDDIVRRLAQAPIPPAEIERRAKRWHAAEPVARAIDRAFDGVVLGRGIGLMEAQALDDYADAETRAGHRAGDEKNDWRRTPAEALNRCNSSLSFFDAEGMRFHLPAYLMAELRGEYRCGLCFDLVYLNDYVCTQFELLDDRQRQAVRAYLLFIAPEPEHESDLPHITRALETFWIDRGLA